jgi:hypothetical protein
MHGDNSVKFVMFEIYCVDRMQSFLTLQEAVSTFTFGLGNVNTYSS